MTPTTPDAAVLAQLNDFSPATRAEALRALQRLAARGDIELPEPGAMANMHCHTFFSYNAYGHSPTSLAWLARQRGYRLMGIVDFDVLDGVDEFLDACDLLGVRGSAGLETRAYLPQFADREINSPGEPGVIYHMGIGFTGSRVPGEAASVAGDLGRRARQRNLDVLARVNAYLDPVRLDYEHDVLPLTPGGNATERHMVLAYVRKAQGELAEPLRFWAERLEMAPQAIADLAGATGDGPGLQNLLRQKLMKRGGVGYVQPDSGSFPSIEEFHRLILACGALPCAAWLDGSSPGEQAIDELLPLLVEQGVAALNIIPDRNWNIADPAIRRARLQKLYEVVDLARALDLPLHVGTEMNSFGQKLVDDFAAPELAPVRQAFLDGAHFIYGHTIMQRVLGMGYQSRWARDHLPGRRSRNQFYTEVGTLVPSGRHLRELRSRLSSAMPPAQVLQVLSGSLAGSGAVR